LGCLKHGYPSFTFCHQFISITEDERIRRAGLDTGRFKSGRDAVEVRSDTKGTLIHFASATKSLDIQTRDMEGAKLHTIATTYASSFILGNGAIFIMKQGSGWADVNAGSLRAVHATLSTKQPAKSAIIGFLSELYL
jgi:hypothetical protein